MMHHKKGRRTSKRHVFLQRWRAVAMIIFFADIFLGFRILNIPGIIIAIFMWVTGGYIASLLFGSKSSTPQIIEAPAPIIPNSPEQSAKPFITTSSTVEQPAKPATTNFNSTQSAFCSFCGAKLEPTDSFCSECGTQRT